MKKEYLFNSEAREKMFKGMETVYKSVSATLGPRGSLVAIDRNYYTDITKDGVSVAKSVFLEDKFENMGAQLLKEAASKSGSDGDGTTTVTILSYALAKEGMKALAAGYSPTDIKTGMEKAVDVICKDIEKKATQVSSVNDIYNVAKVSSNGDEKIASLVKEAFEKVGNEALITVEESSTQETTLTIKEGMTIPNGYISPYFANNEKMESVLKNAYVLVTDQTISTISQLMPILEPVAKSGRPLFIIAEDVTGEALPVLVINNQKQSLRVNAIKAPSYGSNKKDILQDIATLTGGTFISEDFGISVSDINLEMLGTAEKIVSDKENTTIIGGAGEKDQIDRRINEIKVLIEEEENERMKDKLRERLSKFNGGVCVLNIAAQTEAQMKEIKDRVEDTICAVRASLKKGIVTGGGITLLLETKNEEIDNSLGASIVKKALEYPLRKLAENADMPADVIVNETLSKSDGKSGYNILTREWDDNLYDKVVDPALVEINALKNALSVTSLLLNTKVAIADLTEEKPLNLN